MTNDVLPSLQVNLAALKQNYHGLTQRCHGQVAAVVKADAYGLGLGQVSKALWAAGCRTFFVAYTREGAALRRHCPDADIFVFAPYVEEEAAELLRHQLKPCLYSVSGCKAFSQASASHGGTASVALHVETGINRLGLSEQDLHQVLENYSEALSVELVMSHLACADDTQSERNPMQLERFQGIRALLPDVPASLANSGGVFLGDDYHFDIVRPGIALYGCDPHYGDVDAPRVDCVATLSSKVVQIKSVNAGEGVGYGASVVLDSKKRLGVVIGGYADGVVRLLGEPDSDAFLVNVGQRKSSLVGRISMDSCTIDLSGEGFEQVSVGQTVQFFGPDAPLEVVARHARTIPYEILTHVGARVTREYSQ
ncbi:MAG: alanine racemase [Pseudomonadota bacterium]